MADEEKKPLEFYQGKDDQWYWRLTAANNEIVGASSEAFSSQPAAVNNFLLLITMGNAEVARAVQEHGMFQ